MDITLWIFSLIGIVITLHRFKELTNRIYKTKEEIDITYELFLFILSALVLIKLIFLN